MYARTKRCYNERGPRTNYVRSSITYCILCQLVLNSGHYQSITQALETYTNLCFQFLYTFHVLMLRPADEQRLGSTLVGIDQNVILYFNYYIILHYIIHLLTAIGLTPGGSSTVHIYTQTVHRTTQ
jgi:hypothetical protein